jgi:NTP pyrophosphatase (non-canonical NTP hydrolase)
MDIKEYQDKAWSFALPTSQNLAYVSFGLIAEVGEYFDKYAKFVRDGGDMLAMQEARKKELGDILWFVAAEATMNGWNLDEIASKNISKLEARRAFGLISGNGDDREDGPKAA